MELRSDDLRPVADLANTLSDTLQTSRSKINNIYQLLHDIADLSGTDVSGEKKKQENQESIEKPSLLEPDKDDEEIMRLKTENLHLLLNIQKVNFLNERFNKIVASNQDIISTLISWLNDGERVEKEKEDEETFRKLVMTYGMSKETLSKQLLSKLKDNDSLISIIEQFGSLIAVSPKEVTENFSNKREKLQRKLERMENNFHSRQR
ncbi:hypothetical protein WICMUC_005494 [Wickerhamomyces mucosus]|uniref:Uncharacterized protein n=1 Tax=Wickerhamomyces mucosus TaxID=1378264 RepID=A0A9P8P7C3_9ASCO|nr:hypothetical protein WICMUC_005494 [Wickerhamomyces mucosus]